MTDWEITNFRLGTALGVVCPFDFDVVFNGADEIPQYLVHGEGILLSSGRVRFNQEEYLKESVHQAGGNPQYFLDYLADWVNNQARQQRQGIS